MRALFTPSIWRKAILPCRTVCFSPLHVSQFLVDHCAVGNSSFPLQFGRSARRVGDPARKFFLPPRPTITLSSRVGRTARSTTTASAAKWQTAWLTELALLAGDDIAELNVLTPQSAPAAPAVSITCACAAIDNIIAWRTLLPPSTESFTKHPPLQFHL